MVEVTMNGEFGFADNPGVHKLIRELDDHDVRHCVVDLTGVSNIDSAGLGLILLVNDATRKSGMDLTLQGAHGQVQKMLEISRFTDIVKIV